MAGVNIEIDLPSFRSISGHDDGFGGWMSRRYIVGALTAETSAACASFAFHVFVRWAEENLGRFATRGIDIEDRRSFQATFAVSHFANIHHVASTHRNAIQHGFRSRVGIVAFDMDIDAANS